MVMINNGNRTEWSPIRSVIIRVTIKNRTTVKRESDLSITSMITDRIGRHEVLLPINHNHYDFRKKEELLSFERKSKNFLKMPRCTFPVFHILKKLKNLVSNALRPSDAEFFKSVFSYSV